MLSTDTRSNMRRLSSLLRLSVVELTPASQTTVLTTLPYYIHQGMIFVPPGYQSQEVSNVKVVHGASPYGSSTIAGGDGSLQPQAQDLAAAEFQGKVGLTFSCGA